MADKLLTEAEAHKLSADEITRLNAENERLKLDCASYEATMRAIAESSDGAELARLNALVDEMREGLEPFAKAADTIDQPWRGNIPREKDSAVAHYTGITLGDFRRARAIIAKAQPPVSHD